MASIKKAKQIINENTSFGFNEQDANLESFTAFMASKELVAA